MEVSLNKIIGTLGFIACCLCGMACVIICAVNQYKAACHRKPGESFFRCSWFQTVLFSPERYSELGLIARAKCIRSLIGFFVAILLGLAIGYLTGAAH